VTVDTVPTLTRDFTVAVFVVWSDAVLLHHHAKLDKWLPPGGHIEPNELPDEAAIREVHEETGLEISLVGRSANPIDLPGQPRQLCRPAGIQVVEISPGHEHIDIVYFAIADGGEPCCGARWCTAEDWQSLELSDEVRAWCAIAVDSVARETQN
jgi:ADP-ribose pyrophosphatase YjhB (NUDIX family)